MIQEVTYSALYLFHIFLMNQHSRQIVWTRNASEAINLVAYSWGMANLKAGDEVSEGS